MKTNGITRPRKKRYKHVPTQTSEQTVMYVVAVIFVLSPSQVHRGKKKMEGLNTTIQQLREDVKVAEGMSTVFDKDQLQKSIEERVKDNLRPKLVDKSPRESKENENPGDEESSQGEKNKKGRRMDVVRAQSCTFSTRVRPSWHPAFKNRTID